MILDGEFGVVLGQTEKEITKAVARICTVTVGEAERPLRRAEKILDLLVDSPAPTKSELVRSLGQETSSRI